MLDHGNVIEHPPELIGSISTNEMERNDMKAYRVVCKDDPATWLGVPPEWLSGSSELDGEMVTGWRAMTEHTGDECRVTGYQLFTATGLYEARIDGVLLRSSVIHPVP